MIKNLVTILTLAMSIQVNASATTSLSVEEQRLSKAHKALPSITNYFQWSDLKKQWPKISDLIQARQLLTTFGSTLWQHSKRKNQLGQISDDRPLYWSRLAITAFVRQHSPHFNTIERNSLIEAFEMSSRGHQDIHFTKQTNKRIIITGFDPFLLDRNIDQSNPSGLAALMLDGLVIEHNGVTAQINTVMIPVRYQDFDDGEIEAFLAPYYALNNVDLIVTISMGRTDFDLEHFPGLRRSVTAPDNLNVYTGANKNAPLVPSLQKNTLSDREFVEFSLPYQAMMKAKGPYKINDNRVVTTLATLKEKNNRTFSAASLDNLADTIAVSGSGGGYLSNEISYRSILLRDKLSSTIPTGHIHTPRISQFDEKINQQIIYQIKAMLTLALAEI